MAIYRSDLSNGFISQIVEIIHFHQSTGYNQFNLFDSKILVRTYHKDDDSFNKLQ